MLFRCSVRECFNEFKKKQAFFGKEFSMFKDNILKRVLFFFFFQFLSTFYENMLMPKTKLT